MDNKKKDIPLFCFILPLSNFCAHVGAVQKDISLFPNLRRVVEVMSSILRHTKLNRPLRGVQQLQDVNSAALNNTFAHEKT